MTMMRAVVTGGAGFVGSHLCARLLRNGAEVTCIDNLLTGSLRNLDSDVLSHPRFSMIEEDAGTAVLKLNPCAFDAVLHLASPASPIQYQKYPWETLSVGAVATLNLLQNFRDNPKARIIMASTSEVYGDPDVHPQVETYYGNVNTVGPRSMYDEAKRFAESCFYVARESGMDVGIIRIFNTYGPGMDIYDGRAVPNFFRQALRGEPITVYGDGTQTRSLTYVDDLVGGIMAMLNSFDFGPYNLGNPEEVCLRTLAEEINDLCGGHSEIVFQPLPGDDPKVRKPSIEQARVKLGWEPKVMRHDGLRKTMEYFKHAVKEG